MASFVRDAGRIPAQDRAPRPGRGFSHSKPMRPYYLTTPIYYVNDRPHIGHCYTTLLADVAARFQRLIRGEAKGHGRVFLLTGTDEHADKVVTSAAEHAMTPQQWADQNS